MKILFNFHEVTGLSDYASAHKHINTFSRTQTHRQADTHARTHAHTNTRTHALRTNALTHSRGQLTKSPSPHRHGHSCLLSPVSRVFCLRFSSCLSPFVFASFVPLCSLFNVNWSKQTVKGHYRCHYASRSP